MPEVQTHGIRIRYDDQGHGEPALLFMPGWCGSRRVFDELTWRCAQRRRTLAIDWRGHGESGKPKEDFGTDDLIDDALAVIEASQANWVVPVAMSHAGWVAIELRRKLGARIPKIVLLNWLVLEAPPPFLEALRSLQDPMQWQQTRERLFSMWLQGLDIPALTHYVREDMCSYPFEMWTRAGRKIAAAYAKAGLSTTVKIPGTATGGAYAVVEHTLAPGALGAPPHRHLNETEVSYILEGTLTVQLGDQIVTAAPGQFVQKPKGQFHTFWNEGPTPVRFLEIISPAGFERYFAELAALFPPNGPPDMQAVIALAQRYNLEFDMGQLPVITRERNAQFG